MAYRNGNGWQVLPRFNTSYTLYDTNYSTLISGPSDNMRIVLKDGPDMKLIKLEEDGELLYYFIDRGGDTGTHNDLAVDNEDRIHVSHHEAELDHLRYALKENGTWSIQSLAYNAGYASSDLTSIALTSSGLPFIMFDYYDRPYDHLKYFYYDGQGWIVDYHLVNYDGYRFDLAMDQNDDLHIVYFPYYNSDALYYIVRYSEDSWSVPIVLDENLVDGKLEMMFDSADFAHIVYPKEDGVGYAVETPAGWITDTITGGAVVDTTLALDKNGNPHIAWYDANNQDLKYAAFDGDDWHFTAVDIVGDVGRYASLAVDNLGRVYIAYYDATNQDLKYAYFDGSTWTTTTLVSEGEVGAYSSLAMPYPGYPAIAYYDAVTRDLMLVYRPFQPTNFSYSPIFSGKKE
jgi:hypothetical protein